MNLSRVTTKQETYSNRDKALLAIGFNRYYDYLCSPLWNIIRKEVLHRDACQCTGSRCINFKKGRSVSKQVHHLSYSIETLLGLNPAALVTLCIDCHHKCEFDDKSGTKLTLEQSKTLTIQVVFGIKITTGKSKRSLGIRFKNRRIQNQETAQRILSRIEREIPEWHKQILQALSNRLVPHSYIEYLGLKKRRKK